MSKDEEVLLHLDKAQERFTSARILLKEGQYGDAAGRAYYAMFHAAHALMDPDGHDPRTHHGLLVLLSEDYAGHGRLSQEEVRRFQRTQDLRQKCDYDPEYVASRDDGERALRDAEVFVEAVRRVLGV